MSLAELEPDLVNVGGFSAVTQPWIAGLLAALGEDECGEGYACVERAALLFFVLRCIPDAEFPGGKWATIQHLEGQVESCLAVAFEQAGMPAWALNARARAGYPLRRAMDAGDPPMLPPGCR